MQSVVKVAWYSSSKGWKADLLLASNGEFNRWTLSPERSFNFELTDERRCTGFAPSPGERTPCPEFRKISSGSQCSECRGKDIYSDYVRGDQQTDLEGDFSVYMAQLSDNVKVGVTRSENIPKRWIEQGADYAVEILSGLEARVALENESNLSEDGLSERVRKEDKLPSAKNSRPLEKAMKQHDMSGDIVDVNDLTVYEEASGKISRKGLFQGELKSVKGQIIGNGRMALALTSGKVVKNPEQRGLGSF